MHARIAHPAMTVPAAMDALQALGAAIAQGGVPTRTLELVHLRASQINGCSVCLDGHNRIARKAAKPTNGSPRLPPGEMHPTSPTPSEPRSPSPSRSPA